MSSPVEALARLVQQLYAIEYRDRLGQPLRRLKALAEARELLDDLGVFPADYAPRPPPELSPGLNRLTVESRSWAPRPGPLDEAPR
jgi:hypothetical protein